MTHITTEMKTHKITTGNKENQKIFYLTIKDMERIYQDITGKKEYIQIEGNLYKPRDIGNITKISQEDRNKLYSQYEKDDCGHRIIYYTDDIPTYEKTKEGHRIYQFTQFKEVLRSINEGGVIKTINKEYKGYYINGKKFTL